MRKLFLLFPIFVMTANEQFLVVKNNQIINHLGNPVILRGVNRSGSEYACVKGTGIFDGPVDDASIRAMRTWNINIVRIPMNETCWLGINGVLPQYSGKTYQKAIENFVSRLTDKGIAVILELHWAVSGSEWALRQTPMPNADHTPEFWKQVALTFKINRMVMFDLYNEPYPDNMKNTEEAWRCWRDGGICKGISYKTVGMKHLVNVVRKTGAQNIILLGGVSFANILSKWLEYKPNDNNLVASFHLYNFNSCIDERCFNATILPITKKAPVLITEIGEDDCNGIFIKPLMRLFDRHKLGYLGWSWNVWQNCYKLIDDYSGNTTGLYGLTFKQHLLEK